MKKKSLIVSATVAAAFIASALVGCSGGTDTKREVEFDYANVNYTRTIGTKTNNETFDDIIINPVSGMRDDFIMGVDASMVKTVEENGGVYYNSEGKEQDVFEIMAESGVNFFRVRVWNNPSRYGEDYGGGNVDVDEAIAMSKRAARVGMNILVDFHYSDFWADPENQQVPTSWARYDFARLQSAVETYTAESLQKFKDEGLDVDMVQIGNEINYGMLWTEGKIDFSADNGFEKLATLLKAGIKGSNSVFPNAYTAIHLANGGNKDEFDRYFTELERYNVNYDIIGASYYPFYHGTLDALQANLNNVAAKFDKPVYVAEISYGFTTDYPQAPLTAANIYNESFEDAGGYLTGIQGQATAVRDCMATVAAVPNNMGLGVFYWEPAWLPVEGADWALPASERTETAGKSTWANQALFSYNGKALPSLEVFKRVKESGTATAETPLKVRSKTLAYTLNTTANEKLPTEVAVETSLGAIRTAPVSWNIPASMKNEDGSYKIGTFTVTGLVTSVTSSAAADKTVTATVDVIANYVQDPGYENQGESDVIGNPWKIEASSPSGEKVIKLDRKTDMRNGTTDMNWYYNGGNFSATVTQTITGLPTGTYTMTSYVMALENTAAIPNGVVFFVRNASGEEIATVDMTDKLKGWGSKDNYYLPAVLDNLSLSGTATIGVRITAGSGAWGHIDDWSLVKKD